MELSEMHNDEGQVLDVSLMQHNAITSGAYNFTPCQMDIMFMLLASLGHNDTADKIYTIHIRDIEAITGRKWNYQQLQDSTETIGSRVFRIQAEKKLTQIWLFSKVEYVEGSGSFDVRISQDAFPYFFDLKQNFTRFQLKSALSCPSRYAKRIYTIACQWRSKGVVYGREGKPYMTFTELKEKLGIAKEYKDNANFKIRVLDVALKQINKNTDIKIELEYLKRGRSFFAVKILVNPANTGQIEIPFEDEKEMTRLKAVSAFAPYGISEKMVNELVKKNTARKAWALLEETKRKISSGKIEMPENIGGYLATIFRTNSLL